jgi:hypothetical protein
MNNDKIVPYVFLILTLVTICCHARVRTEDWQDIKPRNEERSFVPRWLEQVVSKRDCSRDVCNTNTDCCSGYCGRRYFYSKLGPYGYCVRRGRTEK